MAEIRLLFTADDDAWKVQPVFEQPGSPPARGDEVPLTFDLDDEQHADLRWYLEEYMDLPDHGSRVRAERIEGQIDMWGHALYDNVFAPQANADLLTHLLSGDGQPKLTVATDDAHVLRLPWELLADGRGPLTRRVNIRRQLKSAGEGGDFHVGLPLRILLVVSRPDDLGFIDPRLTTRSILNALLPLGEENVVVDFCRPPTLARMDELLSQAQQRGEPYTIVHFDGHGTYDPVLGLGLLCFERAAPPDQPLVETKTDPVRAERLGKLLAAHRIPLAILEACRSGQMDNLVALRGVAPRLVAAGVGSVVAMSHAVHVEATRVLLDRFYRELVGGVSIGQALDQGRAALIAQPHRWIEPGPGGRTVALKDWYLPQLYQRGDDLVLVETKGIGLFSGPPTSQMETEVSRKRDPSPLSPDEAAFDVFLSHSDTDEARVEAIAKQLRNRHGLRVWFDAWQLASGPLHERCATGVALSRIMVVCCSRAALESKFVNAELQMAFAKDDPGGERIVPVLLEDVELPVALKPLLSYDLREPDQDEQNVARLAAAIGGSVSAVVRGRRRPPERGRLGAFPRPPLHKFQGRARELYRLEQQLRTDRAVLLHAMGGMGKTSLAREAAYWWTRTGLFPDGACFISFEHPQSPEQISLVLGTYLEGEEFEQLDQQEQLRRARELFQQKRVLVVWDNFESVLPAFSEGLAPQSFKRVGGHPPEVGPPRAEVRDVTRGPLGTRLNEGVLDQICDLFADWTDDERGLGRLLITCRPGETPLAGARRFELHGLARADSMHLLHRVMQRVGIEPDAERLGREGLAELVKTLGDHPLSIELVGPHLAELTPQQIIDDFDALLEQFSGEAEVERNRSLLASLRFSTDRLSPEAQAALPWLGLFRGGVFEDVLLKISQIAPDQWDVIRGELEATALIRVENDIQLTNRPYLRFHPTLPYAAGLQSSRVTAWATPRAREEKSDDSARTDAESQTFDGASLDESQEAVACGLPLNEDAATRERYIGVYRSVGATIDSALRGSNPRGGMEVMAREEANFRQAVEWAVADGQYPVAGPMGETFHIYLRMSARFREGDRWVAWLADEAQRADWTQATADAERHAAWSQLTQGQPQQALARMQALIERLEQTTEFDPAFQLATARQWFGRMYQVAGAANRAIPILEQAVWEWERLAPELGRKRLADEADGGDEMPEATGSAQPAEPTRAAEDDPQADRSSLGNLAATLGDLANALRATGRLDKALETAERAGRIVGRLGDDRSAAASIGMAAKILVEQGRYREAEERYESALATAKRAGDKEMEGCLVQNWGILARQLQQYDQATERYKQALRFFQEAGNEGAVMRTCNLLGVVEQEQGRLAEARAWYERSREIAHRRQDRKSLGDAAQNIGIICQQEGERLREQGQEEPARQQFAEAERFLLESLYLTQERGDVPGEAMARGQLAQLYLRMGELDKAEEHAHRAREIGERLGDLRSLSSDYQTLKRIAQAHNDAQGAAEWAAKEQAVDEELERRARGGDDESGGPAGQMVQVLAQLAVACVQAAANNSPLPPDAAGLLEQLDSPDAGPLQPLADYLRQLAAAAPDQLANQLAHPPANLPEPLPEIFAQLHEAVQETGLG